MRSNLHCGAPMGLVFPRSVDSRCADSRSYPEENSAVLKVLQVCPTALYGVRSQ